MTKLTKKEQAMITFLKTTPGGIILRLENKTKFDKASLKTINLIDSETLLKDTSSTLSTDFYEVIVPTQEMIHYSHLQEIRLPEEVSIELKNQQTLSQLIKKDILTVITVTTEFKHVSYDYILSSKKR